MYWGKRFFFWLRLGLPVLPLELRQLLPESITNSDIFSLSNLQLNGASLKSIPPSISILTTLDELHLVGNNLNKIPPEVGNLSRLSMLNLMDNHLLELPDTIGNLTSLKNLGLKSNLLTSLPGSISNLTNLIGIFLTNNKLTSLPSEIGYLTSLRKLQCANNALSQLPSSMSSLRSLELMRLAGNQVHTTSSQSFLFISYFFFFFFFPIKIKIGNDQLHSIFRMPHLRWLTLSANPLSKHVPPDHLPPFISQAELDQLLNGDVKLGEGASGEVRKIRWQNRDGAVKLFKSTSKNRMLSSNSEKSWMYSIFLFDSFTWWCVWRWGESIDSSSASESYSSIGVGGRKYWKVQRNAYGTY